MLCTICLMTVGVCGFGRFGSLWASLLAMKFDILAYDIRGDQPVADSITLCKEIEEIFIADAVFFCVPISAFVSVLRSTAAYMRPGQVICDTCSVKQYPVHAMQSIVPRECHIIATHPLFGPDSAHVHEKIIITYPLRCPEELFEYWCAVFRETNLQVVVMDPDTHDSQMAYTQGITHLIGRVLSPFKQVDSPVASHGYQQVLQVIEQTCNDSLQLFLDMHNYNSYSKELRKDFKKSLNSVMSLIDTYDVEYYV